MEVIILWIVLHFATRTLVVLRGLPLWFTAAHGIVSLLPLTFPDGVPLHNVTLIWFSMSCDCQQLRIYGFILVA